ncbi:uncharacterized protein TNCV_1490201 [Trichonephila clavipes]|nr:uncharacterized protein TNCV_1490201 [Trichonephila clavipes]
MPSPVQSNCDAHDTIANGQYGAVWSMGHTRQATVFAEQLTLLDAGAFGCSDISELGLSLPEAEQSPDSVTFKHLSEWTVRTILAQFCPKRRAQIVSHFIEIANILHQMRNVHSEVAILSALASAPIERLKVSCPQEPKAKFSHSMGAAVQYPRDGHGNCHVQDGKATRGLLATDHVILNHGQVTWTTPELAPPLLTTTPHQREDVSALDRFSVHRCPTRRVFSGTGLELVTKPATIRCLYHSATAASRSGGHGDFYLHGLYGTGAMKESIQNYPLLNNPASKILEYLPPNHIHNDKNPAANLKKTRMKLYCELSKRISFKGFERIQAE